MITHFRIFPLVAFLMAGLFQNVAVAESKTESIYDKVVRSVVAIVPDLEGEDDTIGTGWVLDAKRKLVLTNHHVVEGANKCRVYFPLFENGEIVSDSDATIKESRAIWAEVIDTSVERDLAIIRLESLPDNAPVLRIAKKNASPGQTIHSIAGSAQGTQGLWAYSTGHVRQRVVGGLANGGETMVLESDMATNCGNSGGPVFDDAGEVVAVVEGHSTEARLVSIYVDRQSVVEYLGDAKCVIAPKTAADYMAAARRSAKEGRYDQAAKMVSRAIKLEPTCEAYCLRMQVWMALDDADLAGADIDEALELEPENAKANMLEGKWFAAYGDDDDASACFTNAIRLAPENPEFRFERAMFRYDIDDCEGAMKDLRRIDGMARISQEQTLMVQRLRGKCQYWMDQEDEAATNFVAVLEGGAADYETLLFMGRIGIGITEEHIPLVYFEAAIEMDAMNEDPRAFIDMIDYHFELDQIDKALAASDRMTDLFPENAYGWFVFGVCQIESSPANAIRYVRHATELDPENKDYQELLAKMVANSAGQ